MASISPPTAVTYKGDTVRKEFVIRTNSVAVNLATTYSNITAWLIDADDTVLQKYSRETLAGHDTADFDQLNQTTFTGRFDINVQRAITLAAATGAYKWVLKVFAVDADFANSVALESFEVTTENSQILQFQELPNKTLG